ncbi:unnamed protein product [Acanthoscelides obtectus]|uniref:Uncharacterized protein n=1 Tax=Acanthoscelides obtectus TaxID=200917 RepID=A0A9P0KPB7_ACAOB|nr:unnamed protein product [Acanthoscelides obtectus]CAK1625172.1 hypothetical protein AOBTE_LOCUS3005 [Acanthoscelides obtectus]
MNMHKLKQYHNWPKSMHNSIVIGRVSLHSSIRFGQFCIKFVESFMKNLPNNDTMHFCITKQHLKKLKENE